MAHTLTIGTRGSKLALVQSEMVAAALRQAHPGLSVELRIISTIGDRTQASGVALAAVGDKGLFIKELEVALEQGEVDLAVHSCKDLPSMITDGLTLAAFPKRATPWDALVAVGNQQSAVRSRQPGDAAFAMLGHGARVGTSSLRRACQLRALRPDLDVQDIRGNVDTRLRKLAEGQYDAIVLAAAGLVRLDLVAAPSDDSPVVSQFTLNDAAFAMYPLTPNLMLPAVAQGILAIECRTDDAETRRLLAPLDDSTARTAALAERALLRRLEGGCQVPIGAYAEMQGERLWLRGLVGALDGSAVLRAERFADANADAEALGTALAEDLLAQGAAALIRP